MGTSWFEIRRNPYRFGHICKQIASISSDSLHTTIIVIITLTIASLCWYWIYRHTMLHQWQVYWTGSAAKRLRLCLNLRMQATEISVNNTGRRLCTVEKYVNCPGNPWSVLPHTICLDIYQHKWICICEVFIFSFAWKLFRPNRFYWF